ncbi:MAG: polymer-forming cytoskeletal protein [Bacillota bacterium]
MMKKRAKFVVLGLMLVLLLAVVGSVTVTAARENVVEGDINKAAGSLEIGRGTTVNGNVTVNMGEIVISGVVNGNVTGNMGQVTIHGDVNGSVEAIMGQVVITGNVSGDVKARMGEVIVDGAVAGNLEADLGNVIIRGTVGGDVNSGLGQLRIPGEVLGGVTSLGKNVIITGSVDGDVTLTRGMVELGPQAVVGGRIYVEEGLVKVLEGSTAGSIVVVTELTEAEVDQLFRSGARSGEGYSFHGVDDIVDTIIGSVEGGFRGIRTPLPLFNRGNWYFHRFTPFLGWYGNLAKGVFNMIVLFAMAALTFTLFPGHVRAAGDAVTIKTGPVFGWGILAVVLAVPLMIFLAITIIGIPLILVEILLLALAGILGYTAITQIVGARVVGTAGSKTVSPLGAIALGALILGVLSMVPVLGGLLSLVLFVMALGAALTTRFGTVQPRPNLGPVEPAETQLEMPQFEEAQPESEPDKTDATGEIEPITDEE